ncbi:MAG: HAD family hydrolase [Deltaproteobacteria bacterium]|nr:HAD family hydrolase [Deltaproteobacteria bacterium]
MNIRFIYFDCIETLIQIESPSLDAYADWAWEGGAQSLNLWDDSESFQNAWKREREQLNAAENCFREGTIYGRIKNILSERITQSEHAWLPERIEQEVRYIHDSFWNVYRARTYVLPEVEQCLDLIARRGIPMGVVSNFMVPGGIQELLMHHGLNGYFQQVVVSCHVGWRKPSEHIYTAAIEFAQTLPGEILFIGDSPEADYEGPRAAGMEALLYDRKGKYDRIRDRIASLLEIDDWLEQYRFR